MIKSIQKIIKVGNSGAVTIPAKEMRAEQLKYGDKVRVTVEPLAPDVSHEDIEMMKLAKKLIKRHRAALEHLAER